MVRLAHDSGEAATVKCQQALGDDSPLEFDEDGYAWVDDRDAADLLVALVKHVRIEPAAEPDSGPMESKAERLARDHWQTTVSTIESGEADDVLDELAEIDDRKSVQQAIEARRE